MNLICFGDSICAGYGARPGTGWVAQLDVLARALLQPIHVSNAGVSGDTTADGLRRMARDVEQHHPDAVYIQFGLNDCSFICRQPDKPWTALKPYMHNMEEMIQRAFHAGARTVFVATNHPVAPDPLGCGTDQYLQNVLAYNEALRRTFATRRGLVFIDLEKRIRAECAHPERLLLADGVHLSPAGNDLYCRINGNLMLGNLER